MMESPVLHLESTVPIAAWEMALVFGSAGCACFACCINSLQAPFSFLHYFLQTTSCERPPASHHRHGKEKHYRGQAERKVNGSVSAPFSPGLHIRSVILGFELGGMNYINQIWNLTEAPQGLKPTLEEIFAKFHDL
jgi:hypothetical protein